MNLFFSPDDDDDEEEEEKEEEEEEDEDDDVYPIKICHKGWLVVAQYSSLFIYAVFTYFMYFVKNA